jgi:hypothetical protein
MIVALVLVSAFLHAAWNALLRLEVDKDRALVAAIGVATALAIAVAGVRWALGEAPFAGAAAAGWAIAAGVLEVAYFASLARALAAGPLGRAGSGAARSCRRLADQKSPSWSWRSRRRGDHRHERCAGPSRSLRAGNQSVCAGGPGHRHPRTLPAWTTVGANSHVAEVERAVSALDQMNETVFRGPKRGISDPRQTASLIVGHAGRGRAVPVQHAAVVVELLAGLRPQEPAIEPGQRDWRTRWCLGARCGSHR